jgi:phage baseplate assembly protein W
MNKELKSFLGTGWAFPPTFNKFSHSVKLVSEIDDIKESILIILDTIPGERIMQPEFGSNLKRLVFEKNDESLKGLIHEAIDKALLNFEPRINFISTEIIEHEEDFLNGFVKLVITFSVIITNTRYNIVYPFYFNEGTNVKE